MNNQSNLDYDGLDGICGSSEKERTATASRQTNGDRLWFSRKMLLAALFLLTVLSGSVVYFFLPTDPQAPLDQARVQADAMPELIHETTPATLPPKTASSQQVPPAEIPAGTTEAAAGTEATIALRQPEGQNQTAVTGQVREPLATQSVSGSATEQPVAKGSLEKPALQAGSGGPVTHPTDLASATAGITSPANTVIIHFHWNSDTPSDWNEQKLAMAKKLIQDCPDGVEITGHTCNIGTTTVNDVIGLSRAKTFRWLLKNAGINVKGIRMRSFGANQPIADNRTRKGRAQNRRAVIACITVKGATE